MFSTRDFLKTLQQTRFDQIGFVKFAFNTLPSYTRAALLFTAEEWSLVLEFMIGKARFCNLRVSLKKVLSGALQYHWLSTAPGYKLYRDRLHCFVRHRFSMFLDKDCPYEKEIEKQEQLFNEITQAYPARPLGDIEKMLNNPGHLYQLGLVKPDETPPSPPPALEIPPFQIVETGCLGVSEPLLAGPHCCFSSPPSFPSQFPWALPYQVVNVAQLYFELVATNAVGGREALELERLPLEKAVDSLGLHKKRIRLPFELERM